MDQVDQINKVTTDGSKAKNMVKKTRQIEVDMLLHNSGNSSYELANMVVNPILFLLGFMP